MKNVNVMINLHLDMFQYFPIHSVRLMLMEVIILLLLSLWPASLFIASERCVPEHQLHYHRPAPSSYLPV